jgi:pimeloyl-ACP methyl ester carboxylesterase
MKKWMMTLLALLFCGGAALAQQPTIVKNDFQIDALDPGIKIFMREKMAQGNTRFANDNIVLFLHGATGPSTCDFDLDYKDYSWADWLVKRGYVVYMGDYRDYGGSTREKAMDEPANKNMPVTRSYLALRDIEAMVDYIKRTRNVQKVTLIGWSWGRDDGRLLCLAALGECTEAGDVCAALQLQRPHQSRAR